MLVARLLAEFKTDKERYTVYKTETGESIQAYYAVKKAIGIKTGKVSKRGQAISEGMKRKHAARKGKS